MVYDSPGLEPSDAKDLGKIPMGHLQWGHQVQVGSTKIGSF